MEEPIKSHRKPPANHPWRNCASSKAVSWSREQSQIRDVSNVSVARPSTLKRKTQIVKNTSR